MPSGRVVGAHLWQFHFDMCFKWKPVKTIRSTGLFVIASRDVFVMLSSDDVYEIGDGFAQSIWIYTSNRNIQINFNILQFAY